MAIASIDPRTGETRETFRAHGAEEIERLYTGLVRLHEDGTPGTQHVVANTTFDEPRADGSISATSAYLVFQAVAAVPLQPIITGTYVDTFAPDGDGPGWHFTERRFGIGRSGLLDHHLTIAL